MAYQSTPQRAINGINTSSKRLDLLGSYTWPGMFDNYEYKNDFSTYNAGDDVTGSRHTISGTSALTAWYPAGSGSLLIQTTGATSGNYQTNYLTATSFAFVPGYRLWFQINVKLSDVATHNTFYAGLVDTLTTGSEPGNGVYFKKADASATVSLVLNKAGTKTTISVGTMVINTAHTLGFYYDGGATAGLHIYSSIGMASNVAFGPNPVYGGQRITAAGTNATSGNLLTNIPASTTGLVPGFGILAGENVAKTATYDYIGVAQQLARF